MAEPTPETAWGNIVLADLRIAECENALEVAQKNKEYWIGVLVVLEAQDAP